MECGHTMTTIELLSPQRNVRIKELWNARSKKHAETVTVRAGAITAMLFCHGRFFSLVFFVFLSFFPSVSHFPLYRCPFYSTACIE